jgi:hypothetical protein
MTLVPVTVCLFALFWAAHLAVRWRLRHTLSGYVYAQKHRLGDDASFWQLARRTRSHMVMTTMVFFFFVHMPLTQEITKLLTCQQYENAPGTYFPHLVSSPTVRCDREPYSTWRSVALVFLCVYSFGARRAAARRARAAPLW